jgi:ABC-type branched-subunit amino acid transport system ATPase component
VSIEPILQTLAVTKRYGGITAVADINFSIAPGDLLCLIGPNGAGKSTLCSLISGTLQPTSGEVRVNGASMKGVPPNVFCRRGIARKFQGTNTFRSLSVRDNLVVAGLAHAGRLDRKALSPDEVLDLVRLRPVAGSMAETIPHGQRQWLEIGMTLMCRPYLLLLDEPTAGMGASDARAMVDLVHAMREHSAVLVVEHNMDVVRALNCRTLVMHQGALIRDASFAEIETDEDVRNAYLGRGMRRHAAH